MILFFFFSFIAIPLAFVFRCLTTQRKKMENNQMMRSAAACVASCAELCMREWRPETKERGIMVAITKLSKSLCYRLLAVSVRNDHKHKSHKRWAEEVEYEMKKIERKNKTHIHTGTPIVHSCYDCDQIKNAVHVYEDVFYLLLFLFRWAKTKPYAASLHLRFGRVMSQTQFHVGFKKKTKQRISFFTWQLWLRIPLNS